MSWPEKRSIWAMRGDARTFTEAYLARVRELREGRGWTQEQMAAALSVPLDRYKKYEIRTPLPVYLIPRFAEIVGREIAYVVTGKSDVPPRGPRRLRKQAHLENRPGSEA